MDAPIINYWEFKDMKVKFSFFDGDDLKGFQPCTQSYGIAFTRDGKIVIGRHGGEYSQWHIPGGTIEKDEHPDNTLIRELDEELSLEVVKSRLLGAQFVEYLNQDKSSHYQLRYAVIINLKTLTLDPDKNILWERKLIDPKDFTKFIKWGSIGEHMLKLACKQFDEWKKQEE